MIHKSGDILVTIYYFNHSREVEKGRYVMEKTEAKNTKTTKIIIAIIILCALIATALAAYFILRPQPIVGDKTIHVEVFVDDVIVRTVTIHTDALYLRGALDEISLIDGDESAYGFMITTVNGRRANDDNMEWWSITVNGDFAMYGVDELPIEDGDMFEIRLMVGYDFDW
jgi:hypothetical protein